MPTLFETRRDRIANFVEWTVLPLLVVFALGLVAGQISEGRRVDQAQAAVAEARREVARIDAHLEQWRQTCAPLLTLTPGESPMVLMPVATEPGPQP
jgi:hypothetical protein